MPLASTQYGTPVVGHQMVSYLDDHETGNQGGGRLCGIMPCTEVCRAFSHQHNMAHQLRRRGAGVWSYYLCINELLGGTVYACTIRNATDLPGMHRSYKHHPSILATAKWVDRSSRRASDRCFLSYLTRTEVDEPSPAPRRLARTGQTSKCKRNCISTARVAPYCGAFPA